MGRITNEQAEERLSKCLTFLSQGLNLTQIAEKTAIKRTTLHRFLCRHGAIKSRAQRQRRVSAQQDNWGKETLDPSHLTPEQLDQARRFGIRPGRYAWLLTCPRGGNAFPR